MSDAFVSDGVKLASLLFNTIADSIATQPEIEKLYHLTNLCIYGDDETDSVCPLLPAGPATLDKRPGGHHFDRDYVSIAREILEVA